MNKLWITTFAIIVSCAGAAHADNDGASMIVKTVDGDNVTLKLEEDQYQAAYWMPKTGDTRSIHLFLYNGNVVPNPETGKPEAGPDGGTIFFEMPIPNIDTISFTGLSPAALDNITPTYFNINIANGTLTITGLTEPIAVAINNIEGVSLYSGTISHDCTMALNEFGSGILVVTVGNQSFKILVK